MVSSRAFSVHAASVLLLLGVAVAPARAAQPETVAIQAYDVLEECPGEGAFHERVKRSARRPVGAASLKVAVLAERSRGEVIGTIVVTTLDGTQSKRSVRAGGCDEVISALALVAALAIDDAALTEEATSDEPHVAAEDAHTSEPKVTTVPPRAPPALPKAPDRPASPESKRPPPAARRLVFSFGAQAALQVGVTPDPMVTAPVFMALGLESTRTRVDLAVGFEPSVRLAGIFGGSDRTTVGPASAQFRWTSGAADVCPLRIHMRFMSLSPCIRFELGVLAAQGEDIVLAREDRRTWASLGVPLRLRVNPWPHVFFELEGQARVPLVRDRFVFLPDSNIFQAALPGFSAAVGAGVTIP
jgi:hypothetical protein